jgi:hypothetical protein
MIKNDKKGIHKPVLKDIDSETVLYNGVYGMARLSRLSQNKVCRCQLAGSRTKKMAAELVYLDAGKMFMALGCRDPHTLTTAELSSKRKASRRLI